MTARENQAHSECDENVSLSHRHAHGLTIVHPCKRTSLFFSSASPEGGVLRRTPWRRQVANLPAGTGTAIVCTRLVWPDPRHRAQGVTTMEPLPPQRRQVERMVKGPVLTVSCGRKRGRSYTGLLGRGNADAADSPCRCRCSSGTAAPWCPARCPSRGTGGSCLRR